MKSSGDPEQAAAAACREASTDSHRGRSPSVPGCHGSASLTDVGSGEDGAAAPGRVAVRPVGEAASAAAAGVRAACQNRSGSDGGSQVRRHCSRASADTCYSALIRAQTAVLGSTVRLKVSGLFFSWPPVSWYQSHLIMPSVGLMPTLASMIGG